MQNNINYDEGDLFELLEDINSPQFTTRLPIGKQVCGYWIKENFNLCWLNKETESFKRFFKFVRSYEYKEQTIERLRNKINSKKNENL